jgi:hypothetical protein
VNTLESAVPVIVELFFLGSFGFLFYLVSSRSGKNLFVRLFLGEIEIDYGDIDATGINGARQSLRLLRCRRRGEVFFVIVSKILLTTQYVKLSEEAAKKLVGLLSHEATHTQVEN